jgi:ectoine hydroxylase-related dioxygenase (phytanoyl-CoA dioxygenase family)
LATSVEPLNVDAKAFFEHGYIVLPDVIPAEKLEATNAALDNMRKAPINGTRLFTNERELLRDKRFFDAITQPRLVETAKAVLGEDLQILDFGAMEDPPGTGRFRSWHSDFHHTFPIVDRPPLMITLLIYLADMIDERGPLYIRPRTHGLLRHPSAEDAGGSFPDELKIAVPAGSAIAFHSNLWHSGSTNATAEPRRLLFSLWGHYWMKRLDEFYETPLPAYVSNAEDPWVRQLFGVGTAAPSVHGADYNPAAYGG